ncbi:hypothetical protein [Sinomicrobium sp.]
MTNAIFSRFPFLNFVKILIFGILLTACNNDDLGFPTGNDGPYAAGYSILVEDGDVLVSGFRGQQGRDLTTSFWVNGERVDEETFTPLVKNQSTYRKAIDEKYRKVQIYRDAQGELQTYSFDQGSLAEDGKVFYYKNNTIIKMDTDSIGTVSSVGFYDDTPLFAGSLGEISGSISGGSVF